MLNFGNKEFRNLQEQVLENAKDIEVLMGRPLLEIKKVDVLPEVGEGGVLYLVPLNPDPNTSDNDGYEEYVWVDSAWELIGNASTDISNMVTTDTDQTISGVKTFKEIKILDGNNGIRLHIDQYGNKQISSSEDGGNNWYYSFNIQPYLLASYSVAPLATNAYNIGTSSKTYKDLYLGGGVNFSSHTLTEDSGYFVVKEGPNNVALISSNLSMFRTIVPSSTNTYNLGKSDFYWKDLYLSGKYYLGSDKYIYLDSSNRVVISNNADRIKISQDGLVSFVAHVVPSTTNNYDLGCSTTFWKDLYLIGSLKDGANTVSVANISSKVTSTFISGTFDSNGESTIDTEQAGTPEGLFIFTYGNCQCFLRLTATMIQNADTTPIRVACPMIYNSGTFNGWLNITKSGYILILKVTDGTNHVDSDYSWTLTKTNLL